MRFLVDAQLPPALCRWLEARGHEAEHVTELLPPVLSDREVAERAESGGYILVSKDEDFVLLRLDGQFRLLWLRCGNTTNRALAAWLEQRWQRVTALLDEGQTFIELR